VADFVGLPEIVDNRIVPQGIDRIGTGCRIAESVSIFADLSNRKRGTITLGDYVTLLDNIRLVTGDTHANTEAFIRIGSQVIVNVGCYLSGEGGLTIEDQVLIGPGVKLLSAGHHYDGLPKAICDHGLTYGPVLISKGAWIGAGAVVLQGVTVGEGAVVGAGSVVTKNVLPFSIVAGNPARILKMRKGFGGNDTTLNPLRRFFKAIKGLFQK